MIYSVGLAVGVIFFFALLLIASPILYKRRIQTSYSIKNMFPFEFTYKSLPSENLYTYIFLALFTLTSAGFFATFDMTYSNGFLIFAMIAGIISSILIFTLFIVPLTSLRFHLILAVLLFVLNFASAGSVLIAAWKSNQEYTQPIKIVVIVLGIIILVAGFVLMLNPRLTLNFKAEEKINDNGEKIYVRPKWVVFAFTEWMNIILFILNIINITIFTFATK